jgi:hypothetical protein
VNLIGKEVMRGISLPKICGIPMGSSLSNRAESFLLGFLRREYFYVDGFINRLSAILDAQLGVDAAVVAFNGIQG